MQGKGQNLQTGNLQPLSKMMQEGMNFMQHNQARSQLLNQLPKSGYLHHEPATSSPQEGAINNNMGHQQNFYYPPNMKQQQNLPHQVAFVAGQIDPYNLIVNVQQNAQNE